MDQETLWKEYVALPTEARQQVDEFIIRLSSKQTRKRAPSPRNRVDLTTEPFVGMWRDRGDLSDSSAWVKSLRSRE
jgi:hypothetical protein